jgi:uncharacterized protein YeaO (DUF488 family)
MTIRIVRLGSGRHPEEGTRIGTVRRPPRGVPKKDFARKNWYDVWFPVLAPSVTTMKLGLSAQSDRGLADRGLADRGLADREWARFSRQYRAEMRAPAPSQALDVLAALSHHSDFSVGCYCQNESRCHRSLLRALLAGRGANIAP